MDFESSQEESDVNGFGVCWGMEVYIRAGFCRKMASIQSS